MFASLMEGLTDAVGFVVGALLGYGLGVTFGLDLFAPGYGTNSIIAIVLVGIGGGMGLQAARYFRSPKADAQ